MPLPQSPGPTTIDGFARTSHRKTFPESPTPQGRLKWAAAAVDYAVMPLGDSISIAGTHTVKEWKTLKAQLDSRPTAALWSRAFDEFHETRINTRYLEPMRVIQEHLQSDLGEGFAIATLFCSLVEFLESTEQGLKYVHRNADPTQNEYSNSGDLFAAFLKKRAPFDKLVTPSALPGIGVHHPRNGRSSWPEYAVDPAGLPLAQFVACRGERSAGRSICSKSVRRLTPTIFVGHEAAPGRDIGKSAPRADSAASR